MMTMMMIIVIPPHRARIISHFTKKPVIPKTGIYIYIYIISLTSLFIFREKYIYMYIYTFMDVIYNGCKFVSEIDPVFLKSLSF